MPWCLYCFLAQRLLPSSINRTQELSPCRLTPSCSWYCSEHCIHGTDNWNFGRDLFKLNFYSLGQEGLSKLSLMWPLSIHPSTLQVLLARSGKMGGDGWTTALLRQKSRQEHLSTAMAPASPMREQSSSILTVPPFSSTNNTWGLNKKSRTEKYNTVCANYTVLKPNTLLQRLQRQLHSLSSKLQWLSFKFQFITNKNR